MVILIVFFEARYQVDTIPEATVVLFMREASKGCKLGLVDI